MKPSFPKTTPSTIALLLLPLALLAFIFAFLYPNEFELQHSLMTASCRTSAVASFIDPVTRKPDFRLLIGILTLPDRYERRHLVRLAYSLQTNLPAHVDVRFVFCNITREEHQVLVALEIMRYDDIIILNCPENMDSGKTYTFFSSLRKIFNGTNGGDPPYDYVMKTDDDTYFRLHNLAESLRNKPREDLYYGFLNPCNNPNAHHYMSGMGYILSWDLVEWIATSEIARNRTAGPEDLVTGAWLRDGKRGKNRFDMNPAMYDILDSNGVNCFRHAFVPDTIAVHKLKDQKKWATTFKYFNVTDGLKPSKLYHIP
ncbi:beta-1,3-galactosyltransferase pvg3 [Cocos nucifera]|uniref:Hexosyltransferase n=1 Tax=Cocos nucifera TaxID=13894 RepID=A0A8K0MUC1_COCNU|nr:beta-1,3-galactosyltransferase pvg3 [Cocos nucifera]